MGEQKKGPKPDIGNPLCGFPFKSNTTREFCWVTFVLWLGAPAPTTLVHAEQSETHGVKRQVEPRNVKLEQPQSSHVALQKQLVDNETHIVTLVDQVLALEQRLADNQNELVKLRKRSSRNNAAVRHDRKKFSVSSRPISASVDKISSSCSSTRETRPTS